MQLRQRPGRLRRVTAYLATTVVAGVAAVTVAPPPALADNFGSTECGEVPRSCVSLANNIYHAVRFVGLGDIYSLPGMDVDTQWVLDNVYNPTSTTW